MHGRESRRQQIAREYVRLHNEMKRARLMLNQTMPCGSVKVRTEEGTFVVSTSDSVDTVVVSEV